MPINIPNRGHDHEYVGGMFASAFGDAGEENTLEQYAAGWTEAKITFANVIMAIYVGAVSQQGSGPMGDSGAKVFTGPHIRVIDNCQCYNNWSRNVALVPQPRQSSHASIGQQYEIVLENCGSVLFGHGALAGVARGQPHTWFQSENHSMQGVYNQVAHIADWAMHKFSGNQQVGPLGYSPYSEKLNNALVFTGTLPDLALHIN